MTDLFKWRHYEAQIIRTGIRWYLRYRDLRYRDLAEMMTERGWSVDHSTSYHPGCLHFAAIFCATTSRFTA